MSWRASSASWKRSEHPVAVHLQLPAMRLGQLPERVAVAGPRPAIKSAVGCHLGHHLRTRSPPVPTPAEAANWAVGRRPVCPTSRSSAIIDGSITRRCGSADDAGGQGRGGLRSRQARSAVPSPAPSRARGRGSSSRGATGHRSRRSPRTSLPPADPPRRRRSTRSTSRPWTSICGPWSSGGPRRHLLQRGRHPGREDPGCPADRPGCRAVLPADHDLHDVVLPDRTPGGPADGPEQVGGDHDRHRAPLADRPPAGRRLRSGDGRQGGAHPRPVRRARAPRHPRGRSATAGHARDTHDQGRLRASRQGIGHDLGTVAGDSWPAGPTRDGS